MKKTRLEEIIDLINKSNGATMRISPYETHHYLIPNMNKIQSGMILTVKQAKEMIKYAYEWEYSGSSRKYHFKNNLIYKKPTNI